MTKTSLAQWLSKPDGPGALPGLAVGGPTTERTERDRGIEEAWAPIPLFVQLLCGWVAARADLGDLSDRVSAVLHKPEFRMPWLDDPDDNEATVDLIDRLRDVATRDQSDVIHAIADQLLVRACVYRPTGDRVIRLERRLEAMKRDLPWPVEPETYLPRALEIADARLRLLKLVSETETALEGWKAIYSGDQFALMANQWRSTFETAAIVLDAEIAEACAAIDNTNEGDTREGTPARGDANVGSAGIDADGDAAEDSTKTQDAQDVQGARSARGACAAQDDSPPSSCVVLPALPKDKRRDIREALEPYRALEAKALPILPIPPLAPVRESLVGELPHLRGVIDTVLDMLVGKTEAVLPPICLVGPPGCGKTTLAEMLADALGLPTRSMDVGGTGDAMPLGISRKWSTGSAGAHLDVLLESQIANPCIVVDEIEKAGGDGRGGNTRDILLSLFEPRSAARHFDRFLEVPVDFSCLNWICTANSLQSLSQPLIDRMRILKCPSPTRADLPALAPSLLRAAYADRGLDARWIEPITEEEIAALADAWPGGSIRSLRRLVDGVVNARDATMARA